MSAESRRQFLRRSSQALIVGALATRTDTLTPGRSGVRAQRRDTPGVLIAYVGSLTTRERGGRGEGISVHRVDPASGAWSRVQVLSDEVNPSYLAVDETRACLYASHSDAGQVSAYRIDRDSGRLTLLNRQPTGGQNPAHVALDPSRRCLLAANYVGGSVAVFQVAPDGALGARTTLVELTGPLGPHRTQQSAPHPHQCRFDPSGRVLAVPDKGLDRIFLFSLDAATGALTPTTPPAVEARPGAGPRHVDFHPGLPFAYVANELDSTVSVFRVEVGGTWSPLQILATTPPTFTGVNTPAAILVTPDGRYVLVSNRGHDSVVSLAVDQRTGMLGGAAWTPAGGRVPRFFCLDDTGTRLFVASQATDVIQAFRIDAGTGALSADGPSIPVGTPTAIAWCRATASR